MHVLPSLFSTVRVFICADDTIFSAAFVAGVVMKSVKPRLSTIDNCGLAIED